MGVGDHRRVRHDRRDPASACSSAGAILEVTASAEDIAAPYTVPVGQLIGVLIVGALVGMLAGWRPARRAAKLDILEAIASE